jgi:hypothetical protein
MVVKHQWNNALTLNGSWNYSKTMDAGGWVDQRYGTRDRNLDWLDMTHKITIYGVYQLPAGRGRKFMGNANRLVDGAIGGWELGSQYTFVSGIPVGFGGVDINHLSKVPLSVEDPAHIRAFAACTDLWNQDSNGSWSLQPITGYYSYSGTCSQPDFTEIPEYGRTPNIIYSGIRARPTDLFDVNFSKNFAIWENAKLQLRVDAFNVLNHQQFGTAQWEYDTGAGDNTFGDIGKLWGATPPRNLQVVLKLAW